MINSINCYILSFNGWLYNFDVSFNSEGIILGSYHRLLHYYSLLSNFNYCCVKTDRLHNIKCLVSGCDHLSLVDDHWSLNFLNSDFTDSNSLILFNLRFNYFLDLGLDNFNDSLIEFNLWLSYNLLMSCYKWDILSCLSEISQLNFWFSCMDFIGSCLHCCCYISGNRSWNFCYNGLDDSLINLNLWINDNTYLLDFCDIHSNILLSNYRWLNSFDGLNDCNNLLFSLILSRLRNNFYYCRCWYYLFMCSLVCLVLRNDNRRYECLIINSSRLNYFNRCLIKERLNILSSDVNAFNLISSISNISSLILDFNSWLFNLSFLSFNHLNHCKISLNLWLLSNDSSCLCEFNSLVSDI